VVLEVKAVTVKISSIYLDMKRQYRLRVCLLCILKAARERLAKWLCNLFPLQFLLFVERFGIVSICKLDSYYLLTLVALVDEGFVY
jgi:hypothetical protein